MTIKHVTEPVRLFFQDWGMPIFLVGASIWMTTVYLEDRRSAVGNKDTSDRVKQIEWHLETGKVPQRLERIETTISSVVSQNQKSISDLDRNQKKLDRQQEKVIESLEILGVPKEAIEPPATPIVPLEQIKIEPKP